MIDALLCEVVTVCSVIDMFLLVLCCNYVCIHCFVCVCVFVLMCLRIQMQCHPGKVKYVRPMNVRNVISVSFAIKAVIDFLDLVPSFVTFVCFIFSACMIFPCVLW